MKCIRDRYFSQVLDYCELKSGARVLDFGCGPGDLLLVCRKRGFDSIGIDSSPRSLSLATERGLNVHLVSTTQLPFEHASFDAIILQSVLEHLSDPLSVLEKLTKYLKPGGVLVLSAPTPGPYFWDDPTHIRPYTPKSLKILGELLGFQIMTLTYVFSFLMGIRIKASFLFVMLNLIPFSLGSNLVAFYRSPEK
ncbi:MAG: class I SAM-dependent methyltransferase [Elusimicrobia bacterium]|nr:class I SAM-dependent methyltransferase [Elusimicrobiota bacterium]